MSLLQAASRRFAHEQAFCSQPLDRHRRRPPACRSARQVAQLARQLHRGRRWRLRRPDSRWPVCLLLDYDFENPRTDYERACRVEGLAGLIDVDGSAGLVVGDAPLETTWLALDDGGLLAGKITVEPGANLEAEVSVLGTAKGDWRDEGFTLEGGSYLLMDALDHGAVPEREPIPVKLPNGTCQVLTARVSTGLVVWSCIRLTQAKEV
ncbi:MAG: hypothetical protein IPI55_17180 [Flavobacteriales bacterium]|nr:hypothetical protein [Flavobacteriales bacterium]